MRKYQNLPSINVELLDGNLRIDEPITGPVVLVIGTASSGPSNTQYLASDSNVAAAIFGSDSPLIQKMSEVKVGGAKNVLLYRIGGSTAAISDLFGADSLIATKEETSFAGSKYSVYIGPTPNDPLVAGLIIFEGDTIVYSNVLGAEVDLKRFDVVGFDETFAYTIGTPTAPVILGDVLASITESVDTAATADGLITTFALPVETLSIDSVTLDAVTVAPGDYSLVGTDIVFTVAPATGALVITGTSSSDASLWATPATYSAGADNVGSPWEKYYELLDVAYADLETTIATHLVTDRAVIDAPNLADGSVEVDKLTYVRKVETDGTVEYVWGEDKLIYVMGGTGETNLVGSADLDENGQPIVKWRFNEVNFAHQMGEWLHNITENDRFVLGVIGTSSPLATTTAAIAKWIGTLPEKDFAGTITLPGTGLLGNRFMSGTSTQVAGYFDTDSGFPDGNVQVDSNGAPIDLGKYMSVVMGIGLTPDNPTIGTSLGQTNAAALYSGILSTILPGESTTNRVVPRISLPFTIKKTKLDDLTFAGYVSLAARARGTVIVSGELATSDNSDYDYVSTAIIVADTVRKIRTRLEPFIGKGLNQVTIAAADTAVESIFQEGVASGAIIKYAYQVLSDPQERGRGQLRVPITIVPAFELRQVSVPIKLAYDI